MLNIKSELKINDFTGKEKELIKDHIASCDNLKEEDMVYAWRDSKGSLCIRYESGASYRYCIKNEKVLAIKYLIEGEWDNGTVDHEDDFDDAHDHHESVMSYFYIAKRHEECLGGKHLIGFRTYVDGKLDKEC